MRLHKVIADGAVALVALVAVATVAYRIMAAVQVEAAADKRFSEAVDDWPRFVRLDARAGSADPLVTIIEFGDFLCPYCARSNEYLSGLLRDFPDQVAVVRRHYALDSTGFEAAVAFECVTHSPSLIADRVRTAFYALGDSLGSLSWQEVAVRAGVSDTVSFDQCMSDGGTRQVVADDTLAAVAAGATSTPTMLVNGIRIRGFPGVASMDSLVLRTLLGARHAR